MINNAIIFLYRIPVRLRMTLWYVFLMGVTMATLSTFLLVRFEQSLTESLDQALENAVTRTLRTLDDEEGQLMFPEYEVPVSVSLADTNIVLRLLSPEGEVLDLAGNIDASPLWGPMVAGYESRADPADAFHWRTFTQPIIDLRGNSIGWVQAAQRQDFITETMQTLRLQLLWAVPVALLLAGLGGYFLASRALRPISRMTRTARRITSSDLSLRIAYEGPEDEIGQLAQTFDAMLGRLQASFARQRQFSADAAHELRTPLSILKGQLEVTLSRIRDRDTYIQTLESMSAQINRLIRLSNGLLLLTRLDRDQIVLNRTHFNLADLLDSIIEEFHNALHERGLSLESDYPNRLMSSADSDLILRLFMNLLDNAVKYTPQDGHIQVQADVQAGDVLVTVSNSGPGIAPEHLPHLFDRFYRIDESRSRESGGDGLGLAISQEIVQAHDGTIEVTSTPERGVTVHIRLPILEVAKRKVSLATA